MEPQWVEHEGRRFLYLKDRLALARNFVLVPEALVPLLTLCDGTRDISELRVAMMLRTGVQLAPSMIAGFLSELDRAYLLEGDTYREASERALTAYRTADHRQPSHARDVYPDDPAALSTALQDYCDKYPAAPSPRSDLVGMVCPHIDYARGHATYAELWQRALPALEEIELAIVFGTDHMGGPGTMTLTRQSYATPLGVLPTDVGVVDGVADALGSDTAFAEEIHHVNEHSIELALVWMHYFLGGRSCPVVPVLCGSFHDFVAGEADPGSDQRIDSAIATLRQATAGRKTLVIAAGDLAHVGPAFGDPSPFDEVALAAVAARDDDSISAICDGDAEAFFDGARRQLDARRLCGLPPIYLALRYLEGARGEATGYAQCPADDAGTSVVSIAGVLLYDGR